ncbi:HHIP-like protein 2 [Diadema antillarum]|uniref:HHIP-like protein 2 n=1 Tax=Diadema antillarum TaxID=105358 RepID=UPI003A869EB9
MFTLELVVLALCWTSVWGHPQCLDFYPPFEPEKNIKSFCDSYSDFGCCTVSRNREIKKLHESLKARLPRGISSECTDFLKDVLCQECSPYAAHLYDAETTHRKTPLPGLCGDYCSSLYKKCSKIIPLLTDDDAILNAYNKGEAEFCKAVQITDMDYCYPNVVTDSFLSGEAWSSQTGGGEGCLCFEEFASGLRNPVLAVHANDHTHRLFIAEQVGVVHVFFRNKTKVKEPFLDIHDAVLTSNRKGDERGFLGLVFHPKFVQNRKLYVYYTTTTKKPSPFVVRISEFQVMIDNPNKVDMTTQRIILEVEEPEPNHNGGQMLFDDQGFLYLFPGDGGKGGDPHGKIGNGQNLTMLLGSILRIDVDRQENGLQYAIPRDNPYVNYSSSERRHEIFAYGARNMWRCSVDRGDLQTGHGRGRIFCGDVGQSKFEEIDIIVKGGNYGWRGREGFTCYDDKLCDHMQDEVLPIHDYPHTEGKCVIGGYVYRGCQYPNLQGKYIYGDYPTGKLFELTEDLKTGKWSNEQFCLGNSSICTGDLKGSFPPIILSFGEDEAGEIYLLSTASAKTDTNAGVVLKIVDPRKRGNPEKCLADHDKKAVYSSSASSELAPSHVN